MPLKRLIPFLVLLAVAAGVLVPKGDTKPSVSGRVDRVVDGDTLVVDDERVRLIGVDTPESVKPGSPVECFAKKASAFTEQLVGGKRVRLEADVEERDRYGRMLAYVYRRSDGLFVNAELVRRGYASVLTIPPNVKYAKRFAALARKARAEGRGLWGVCDPPD